MGVWSGLMRIYLITTSTKSKLDLKNGVGGSGVDGVEVVQIMWGVEVVWKVVEVVWMVWGCGGSGAQGCIQKFCQGGANLGYGKKRGGPKLCACKARHLGGDPGACSPGKIL